MPFCIFVTIAELQGMEQDENSVISGLPCLCEDCLLSVICLCEQASKRKQTKYEKLFLPGIFPLVGSFRTCAAVFHFPTALKGQDGVGGEADN